MRTVLWHLRTPSTVHIGPEAFRVPSRFAKRKSMESGAGLSGETGVQLPLKLLLGFESGLRLVSGFGRSIR